MGGRHSKRKPLHRGPNEVQILQNGGIPNGTAARRRQMSQSRESLLVAIPVTPVRRRRANSLSSSTAVPKNRGLIPVGKVKEYYEKHGLLRRKVPAPPTQRLYVLKKPKREQQAVVRARSMTDLRTMDVRDFRGSPAMYAVAGPGGSFRQPRREVVMTANGSQHRKPSSSETSEKQRHAKTPIFVQTDRERHIRSTDSYSMSSSTAPSSDHKQLEDSFTQTPDGKIEAKHKKPRHKGDRKTKKAVPPTQLYKEEEYDDQFEDDSSQTASEDEAVAIQKATHQKPAKKAQKSPRKTDKFRYEHNEPPTPPPPPTFATKNPSPKRESNPKDREPQQQAKPHSSNLSPPQPWYKVQPDTFRKFKHELHEKFRKKEATRHIWEEKLNKVESPKAHRKADSIDTLSQDGYNGLSNGIGAYKPEKKRSYEEQVVTRDVEALSYTTSTPVQPKKESPARQIEKLPFNGNANSFSSSEGGVMANRDIRYAVRCTDGDIQVVNLQMLRKLQNSGLVIEHQMMPPVLLRFWEQRQRGVRIGIRDLNGVRIRSRLLDDFVQEKLLLEESFEQEQEKLQQRVSATFTVVDTDYDTLDERQSRNRPPSSTKAYRAQAREQKLREMREQQQHNKGLLQIRPSFEGDHDYKNNNVQIQQANIVTPQTGVKLLVNHHDSSRSSRSYTSSMSSPRGVEPYDEGVLIRIGEEQGTGGANHMISSRY